MRWQAQPPLSRPDTGFWHLEVPQAEVVAGRPVLMFSCMPGELDCRAPRRGERGGVWSAPGDSVLGPFDISRAAPLTGEDLYSGRLIRDRTGRWLMLAFHNLEQRGGFVGEITNPMPVSWAEDGTRLIAGPELSHATAG